MDLPAEGHAEQPQRVSESASHLGILDPRNGQVRERASEEHVRPPEEEDEKTAHGTIVVRRVLDETDGIVPAEVHDDGHHTVPEGFDVDVRIDVS